MPICPLLTSRVQVPASLDLNARRTNFENYEDCRGSQCEWFVQRDSADHCALRLLGEMALDLPELLIAAGNPAHKGGH